MVVLVDGGGSNVVVGSRNITFPSTYRILRIVVVVSYTYLLTFILCLRITELTTYWLITMCSTHYAYSSISSDRIQKDGENQYSLDSVSRVDE
jgi:hypothetical protein